ncbi:AbiH family protein [Capnocytophaga canimorsus]|uniref:AbiH family protein n=1 Tax=Capnocytophaga canimorsus TaxID=28188 RepID=UPI0037CE8006
MNVLFIIGNGFDLRLGLPTSYSDFLKYYKGKEPKNNPNIQGNDLVTELALSTALFCLFSWCKPMQTN